MALDLATGPQAFLPRIVVYTIIGTTAAWLLHLMQPALQAALSKDYQEFSWAGGKRGVGIFLKATYEVAFKSRDYFKNTHRKVTFTGLIVSPPFIDENRYLKLAMAESNSFLFPTAALVLCSWYRSNS
jgi:hypothetical protein